MKYLSLGIIILFWCTHLYATNINEKNNNLPVVHLKPRIKIKPIPGVNEPIPFKEIAPFLNKSRVIEIDERNQLPTIIGTASKRILMGVGDHIYAEKMRTPYEKNYMIIQADDPYIDPKTKKILGYPVLFRGRAVLEKAEQPTATLTITESTQEIRTGDLLLPDRPFKFDSIKPQIPVVQLQGYIVQVLNKVEEIGKFNVVVINKGLLDGIRLGDKFEVVQEQIPAPDDHYAKPNSLPKLNVGTLMVFRTFKQLSFALITRSKYEIHVGDQFISEKEDES